METLGQKLKAARLQKKLTASEAAKLTRIKIQHIEAMEHDDFSSMPAAAYAKGFIRIYAELLELDAAPLLAEYQQHHAPTKREPLLAETSEAAPLSAPPPPPQKKERPPKSSRPAPSKPRSTIRPTLRLPRLPRQRLPDLDRLRQRLKDALPSLSTLRLPQWHLPPRKAILYGVGLLLFIAIFISVARCGRIPPETDTPALIERTNEPPTPTRLPPDHRALPLIDNLPEPYLE
jgi:transcriptional regulator with XRE-family HTH domain